ncbi:MAG: aminopeptidase N [Alphaproteobacteria bacterium]|nr:aminopeptidase N [Alphaproteobacteria bacterium]
MTTAKTIFLADYQAPSFLIDEVHLTFRLSPNNTRVLSQISFRRNPEASGDLVLNGEGLTLIGATLDGSALTAAKYDLTQRTLTIRGDQLPDKFEFAAEVEINPAGNTSLNGLYTSKGMFCTQCEAEGFRKITYYPDRPDVMAKFTVRIEGDLPVMLSNGNCSSQGEGWVEWQDPWPKPAYLFALVAGDLVSFDDRFTTASGREVDLKIWVREGDQKKCAYAMDSLKRSMKWDEETYGREYDLDLFQIVAVDDFNMGAMENKGLNIFNSKYVLASPETATDQDYALIEGIIAHEYFHNWTGNRITCRDWFQLSLKEGLTVFRDQSFSGDQRSRAVKRITEVQQLRAAQFREDAGPLAHPVRPAEYKEINNFYTATVYNKGAELIGMLHSLVGEEAYRRALDLYFKRHDGQACTIEDWLRVFEDTTGRDLSQFKLWYSQSGTPRVSVSDSFKDGTYTLTFRQTNPPTVGQSDKKPQVIPIKTGLIGANGDEVVATRLLELTKAEQSFSFTGLSAKPVASLLRNFSAPVILERPMPAAQQAFLLAHDTDPFNKWEVGQNLARDVLVDMVLNGAAPDPALLEALHLTACDTALDPAFRALVLSLPTMGDIIKTVHDLGKTPDPTAIFTVRRELSRAIAARMGPDARHLYDQMTVSGAYNPDAKDAGKRALRAATLTLLTLRDGPELARYQYQQADNMTEKLGALASLLSIGEAETEAADFYQTWQSNELVIDKWFMLQAGLALPDQAVKVAKSLAEHKDFDWKNPNRFRGLIAGFANMNPAGFHDPSGEGYRFVTDWLLRLDPINPQTTARMSTVFETWRWFDQGRQQQMRAELNKIAGTDGLSRDTSEMVERILKG